MVAWAGIIGAALFGRAAAQVGSWSMYAGYEPASDVGSHSMIDLDMAELETAVGEYATSTVWISDALFIYDAGGNGGNGNSIKGSGEIRTLKGFATKDYSVFTGNYAEQLPPIYTAYWAANGLPQAETWANTFITKDYSAIVKDVGWAELIQKGANYQAVWMYVIHELEDAIGDCFAGDITANDDSVHAWDEAWAFYAGSMVGTTTANAVMDDGTLIWELAEKRGKDFGTTHSTGPATVNVNLLAEFIDGRDKIIAADCAGAEPIIDNIIKQMSIPLIQGTLKYAYWADPATAGDCAADAGKNALTASDGCVKSWAEAWAFAAAVLPQVAECDWGAAETIRYSLDIEAAAPVQGGFYSVKSAIESTYRCLGITCADVGAYPGTMPCSEPDDDDDDDDDDDLLDGGLREVMSLAPMGLAAIGITFTGITIATLVNLAQEQCALGPTIIFEAGTTHPYYITPNLCTIGAHTYSSKKTVRDASPRKVCRKFCEAASAAGKLALKQVHGLTCYCKRK